VRRLATGAKNYKENTMGRPRRLGGGRRSNNSLERAKGNARRMAKERHRIKEECTQNNGEISLKSSTSVPKRNIGERP